MATIVGHEYPVCKIFSPEFDFVIPPYQRPYAWTTEEAGELFDDLNSFMNEQQKEEPYFLGSIVLVKREGEPRAEVIDGQQRLVTLTLLLAMLVKKLSRLEEQARSLFKYINEPGDLAEDRPSRPRLALRERDREFFYRNVQETGGLERLLRLREEDLADPERNLQANAQLFEKRLAEMDDRRAFEFGKSIVNRCYLVAVSTPSMQSAYRIFSVLNDRGLDLLTCDILKSDIIGQLPSDLRDKYTDKWEEVEEDLGRDAFDGLFTHIRMIYQKDKLRTTVLDEFREHVLKQEIDSTHLIDEVLLPYAKAYEVVSTGAYESKEDPSSVNETLGWLRRIDNVDWIPPAMLFMYKYQDDVAQLKRFYRALERLAASMFIRRADINDRISRYGKLIQAIEDGVDLWAEDSPLMLSEDERRKTLESLGGEIYTGHKRVRTYVMLRLDSFLSDKAAVYDRSVLTVEHVLPQTVRSGSYWERTWPDESTRKKWVHCMGNLVLLSRRKNSEAQNYDFDVKKEKYFKSLTGVSSFAITTQVLLKNCWTPDVVEKRQAELLGKFKEGWELHYCDNEAR